MSLRPRGRGVRNAHARTTVYAAAYKQASPCRRIVTVPQRPGCAQRARTYFSVRGCLQASFPVSTDCLCAPEAGACATRTHVLQCTWLPTSKLPSVDGLSLRPRGRGVRNAHARTSVYAAAYKQASRCRRIVSAPQRPGRAQRARTYYSVRGCLQASFLVLMDCHCAPEAGRRAGRRAARQARK